MRVKNCINSIANHEGVSISSIARAVGQSPQNLGQKLNRDSIRIKDLLQIAEALDMNVCLVSKDDPDDIWLI